MLGPVMIGIRGKTLSAEEKEMLKHPLVGGVILFTRNYDTPEQVSALTDDLRRCGGQDLLVAVDQEGGRVQRFRAPLSVLPPLNRLGEMFDQNPQRALSDAESLAWLMAAEVRALGVDFSFAPVLDVSMNVSSVIGDRAFHAQPQVISQIAAAYIRGMRAAGMAATGKHFPGHGAIPEDTHFDLATDPRTLDTLLNADLVPFLESFKHGLAAVMMAHVIYPDVDDLPAGFSNRWVSQYLRQRWGFEGVVVSDDLEMAGAAQCGNMADRARLALAAGCDLVLVCQTHEAVVAVLDNLEVVLDSQRDSQRSARLLKLKGQGEALSWPQLQQSSQWLTAQNVLASYVSKD